MSRAWRTARVFVSSTFRDMHAERNHLVRVVFPALRERLEPLRVHLIDIDLRWGVTREQADNNQVLDLCLRYVDECRPFYIGIIGERYGWIPDRLPAPTLDEFPWLRDYPARSLTELEILHAVLHYPQSAGHAFFYFRDPAALRDVPDQIARDIYLEADPDRAGKLRELKEAIRRSGFPLMESYPARWAPDVPNRGDGANGQLAGLDAFGDRVFEQLWDAITVALGLDEVQDAAPQDAMAEEGDYHERFMESRLRVYVGRNTLEYRLRQYVGGGATAPCVLTGPSGAGKSAALARLVTVLRTSRPDWLVIPHFVGASPESTDVRRMLRRFCGILRERFGFFEEVPSDPAEVIGVFDRYLAAVPAGTRVAIVIDALNQLDTAGNAHALHWLPAAFLPHVKLVASCIEDPDRPEAVLDAFRARAHLTIGVDPLSEVERFQIVHDVPSLSAKTLDHTQVAQLLSNPATTNPLFLLVALEELRGFGSFEGLHDRIGAFPREGDAITALFTQVIERLEDELGALLIRRILTSLAAARRGLSERELRELVGSPDLFPALRQLRPYLQHRGALFDFYHRNLFKAVRARYLATPAQQMQAHGALGDYFEAQEYERGGPINVRKVDEVAWQRVQAEQWDHVERLFTDPAFLESKTEAGLLFDLADEFHDMLVVFPPGRPARRILRLLDEALRRDLHFIVRHPTTLFQCLWNYCWWYDCPAAALWYAAPEPASGPPPWERSGPRLFELLEAWRASRESRGRKHPWLRSLRPPAMHLGAGLAAVLKTSEGGSLYGLSFMQNDERLVSGLVKRAPIGGPYASTIVTWDTQSGEQLPGFPEYAGHVTNLCCSPDNTRIVSGSSDGALWLWDVATRQLLRTGGGHDGGVGALVFSPNGRCIASSSQGGVRARETGDATIRIWDPETLEARFILSGHDKQVRAVAFSPDGLLLASASADGTLRLWNPATGTELAVLYRSEGVRRLEAVAWFSDGRRVAFGSSDKTIRVVDAVTGEVLQELSGHEKGVTKVGITSDGRRIASGSAEDRTLRLWNAETGSSLRLIREVDVSTVAFSSDDRWIANEYRDVITLWDVAEGEPLLLRQDPVDAKALSRDGRLLATTGERGVHGRICDFETAVNGWTLKGRKGKAGKTPALEIAAFSSDGARLATFSSDHAVRIWDVESGEEMRIIPAPGVVKCLAFSPDDQWLAAGTGVYDFPESCKAHIWITETGAPLYVLKDHRGPIHSVVFCADGRRLATASDDGTVLVWDCLTGDVVQAYPVAVGGVGVHQAVFSSDGKRLITESWEAVVFEWDVESGDMRWQYDDQDDPRAVAAGLRFRALVRALDHGNELIIKDGVTGARIAWFPTYFHKFLTHPSGLMWAGQQGAVALEDFPVNPNGANA